MTRRGKTSAGRQRWRCRACGGSQITAIDATAKHLTEFLAWLLSRDRQVDMPGAGRSSRRRTAQFWRLWPMPVVVDEIHDVVFVDGIHLGRKAVVLIARNRDHALGWYLARSENSRAWGALLERIAPPVVVDSDGGSGFAKAVKQHWPETGVQRCVFHAFNQIKTATTSRPKLAAGQQLYGLGRRLMHLKTVPQATIWLTDYNQWCTDWNQFLAEKTMVNRRWVYTHQRLVKARGSLNQLIGAGTLFTYLIPELAEAEIQVPTTNNLIEGGTNALLRAMLRDHRGMSLIRRIKAIFWWCYQHTENPLPPAQLLKTMPDDEAIKQHYDRLHETIRYQATIPGWGDAIAWSELHHSAPWRNNWD